MTAAKRHGPWTRTRYDRHWLWKIAYMFGLVTER